MLLGKRTTFIITFLLVIIRHVSGASFTGMKDNVLTFLKLKKQYTPYLYFSVPKGEYQSCDEMDKIVAEIEKECNIHIERFNVRKNKHHASLRQILSNGSTSVPFLYHRESRQAVRGVASKEKVRAWAKGRWVESALTIEEEADEKKENAKKGPPMNMEDESDEPDDSADAFSLMEFKGKKQLREEAAAKRQQQ